MLVCNCAGNVWPVLTRVGRYVLNKGGQICVTAVDGMNVPPRPVQPEAQKSSFAILPISILIILTSFNLDFEIEIILIIKFN